MKNTTSHQVHDILEQLASIQSMERGNLSKFYRTSPAADGSGKVRVGPYHKLQAWENGRNHTRHIPASEVPELERDLLNYKEFKQLVDALEQSIITETRARKAGTGTATQDSKKNSTRKRFSKDIGKQRASSPKPKSV